MSYVKNIVHLLSQPNGIVELFRRASTDEQLAEQLDELDDVSLDEALDKLYAIEGHGDADDDDADVEDTANLIRQSVQLLFVDASSSERSLVEGIDPLVLDGALEAMSNVFRRGSGAGSLLIWSMSHDVMLDKGMFLSRDNLHLEVARYVGLWREDLPAAPATQVVRAVGWARAAIPRIPELFRHVVAVDVDASSVWLAAQPRSAWQRPRAERWTIRNPPLGGTDDPATGNRIRESGHPFVHAKS